MSSAFDSEVYAERQRLPGVTISLTKLMQELLWAEARDTGAIEASPRQREPVTLTLEYRPDVETSMWWTLRWGEQFAAATTLELCLFRAAILRRRDDERAKRYAGMIEDKTHA